MVSDKTIGPVAMRPTMSFGLFLLCSFVLLARPQDILTFLQPMRPALVTVILATAAMVLGGRLKEISAVLSTAESKRYLLFFLIMIVGIPFAYYPRLALAGVFQSYLINMLFFFLLVSQVTSLQRLKSFLWVTCLATLTYSVFGGILQSGVFGDGRVRVFGNMFDANDTAYVLVSLFPLCLYFVRFNEGLLKRLVAIVAAISAIAIILQTGSRGGLLAFGTVLLIVLLTTIEGVSKGNKIFFVVILATTVFLIRDKIDMERYLTLSDISSDYNVTDVGGRLEIWQQSMELIRTNPITGVGFDCFAFAVSYVRELAGESYLRWQPVHNSYLQIASEIGLIGFGIFVLINLRTFFTFLHIGGVQTQQASRETSEMSALGSLMLLGFTGLSVSGLFLTQGYSIFSTLYFALAAVMGRLQVGIGTRSTNDAVNGATIEADSRHAVQSSNYPQ
jgi:O-antigen ligase